MDFLFFLSFFHFFFFFGGGGVETTLRFIENSEARLGGIKNKGQSWA